MSDHARDGGDSNGTAGPASGRVDRAGRLVAADPPLARLHAAAEGEPGGRLTIPQLVSLVALARREGAAVARSLLAADETQGFQLEARAWPEGDDIHLSITGWESARIAAADAMADVARRHDWLRADADWLWQVDQALHLTALAGPGESDSTLDAAGWVGLPLSRLFALLPDARGGMPLLDALGERRGFTQQLARLTQTGAQYRLAAIPRFDGDGRFCGFDGGAEAVAAQADGPPAGFGGQLDQALRGAIDRIVGSADAIAAQADGPLRRDYAGYAEDIAVAGRHLLGLIGDLVDAEAIERGDFGITTVPFDLADVARRAIALLAASAAARRITLDGPAESDATIAMGDYRRALQIVVNLASNAVRYAPEASAVRIRVEREGDRALVIVADQGGGIAPEHRERIFDKYERLGAAEPGGSGLGLYIARRLARAMSGDLTVDGAPGQGARFTLALPGG